MAKLSEKQREAIKKALPALVRLGLTIPEDIQRRIKRGEAVKLNRDEVKKIQDRLTEHGRIVVVSKPGSKTISVFTYEGYKNRGISGTLSIGRARAAKLVKNGKAPKKVFKLKIKKQHWTQKLTPEQRQALSARARSFRKIGANANGASARSAETAAN